MIEGWHRPEYVEKELPILKEKIDKEKNPEMKALLIARYRYLEKEAHPFDNFENNFKKSGLKGLVTGTIIKGAMSTPYGGATVLGVITGKAIYDIYQGTKEEPRIAITTKQANDIKRIAPEFYKDIESSFIIGEKSDVPDSGLIGAAEYYYKNSKTPDGKLGDITGFLVGAKIGQDVTATFLNRPSLYIYKQPNPSSVPVNELTNGGQFLLGNNPNSMLPAVYKAENTALVLYRNPNLLTAPVGTDGALAITPLLLTDVPNKVSQVQNKFLPYNPNLVLPVKYPIVTESGVTIYKDYAIGIRGGEYKEAGITKDSKIAYRNNGSYYVIGEGKDGFKNIPARDVTINKLVSESGGKKGNLATREAVDSITKTGKLPNNYITKAQAKVLGWSEGKALNNYAPGKAIGGDVFNNFTGILPMKNGRIWYEADVGINYIMSRSNFKNPGYRILYSSDGLIYGTYDHYKTVFPILP